MKNSKIKKNKDSADIIDWSKAKNTVFPDLKPTYASISIRIPKILLEELKMIANRRDVPYQSLMKTFIAERVKKELVNR